jgi:cytochrome P450 family 89 subfamily A
LPGRRAVHDTRRVLCCRLAALVREFEWALPADDGSVDLTATNALFVKVMAAPLRARITPRTSQSQT